MNLDSPPLAPGGQVTPIRTEMTEGGTLTLAIDGRLDSTTTGKVWLPATEAVEQHKSPRLIVDATKVDYCDGSGIGLLVELQRRQHQAGGAYEIRGLRREFQQMLSMFNPAEFEGPQDGVSKLPGLPDRVGRAAFRYWEDIRALIAFVGELGTALYGDFRENHRPSAVIEIEFSLIREDQNRSQVLYSRQLSEGAPVRGDSPESLVEGWNQALEKILVSLEADLSKMTFSS